MPDVHQRRQVLRDVAVAGAFVACWFGGMAWALDHGWYPFSRDLYVLAGLWTAALLAVGARAQRQLYVLTLVGYPLAWSAVGPRFGLYEELLLAPLFLAAYRVSSAGRLAVRWALPAGLLVVALVTVQAAGLETLSAAPYRGRQPLKFDDLDLSQLLFQEAVMAALVLLGRAEHQRHRALAMLAARNTELVRLRRLEADQVVAAERTRIARELHDVVAHHVSAIVIRAQAADRVADRRPHEPREAVRWIATAGQDALRSMRRVVDVLHTPPPRPLAPTGPATAVPAQGGAAGGPPRPAGAVAPPHGPEAGLGELPDVVARVTGAGVPVTLTVGELPSLPAHVELAALRIVQEALTNVLLHARASRAAVDIACREDRLWVSVDDDGPHPPDPADHVTPQPPDPGGRSGNGLPGMRARAVLCGGTLLVEPGRLGGWRIRVCLPLGAPLPPEAAAAPPPAPERGREAGDMAAAAVVATG